MAILFFDTETTGLPDKRAPFSAPHQPHVVQIAALLTDDAGTDMASINMIVNPGVEIPAGASAVHGITNTKAVEFGVHPKLAALAFKGLLAKAQTIVAHNIAFDLFLLDTLFHRQGVEFGTDAERVCTMEWASPIVNLPPTERMLAAGFTKPKPPKLEEVYRFLFDEELDGAHDAFVDVTACRAVYTELRRLRGEGV